jgi:microcystin-dependent protein
MLKRLRFMVPVLVALGLVIPLAYAADTTTPNLLLTNQEAGGNLNTWGDIADANYERIDDKLGDTTEVATTGGTTVLTSTQELVQIIEVSGTLVSDATLEFSCRGGFWVVSNETSGDFTVTANCNGTTTTGTVITQGTKLGVYSDGSEIRSVGATGTKSAGEVFDFAGTSCPAQSVSAYGQSLDATTYSALFAALGTTYGTDAGNVVLPDLRGRVVAGEDDMGGSSANRLTTTLNGDTLGAAAGQELHTMTSGELVAHGHGDTFAVGSHTHSGSYSITSHTHSFSDSFSTSSDSHSHSYVDDGDTTQGNVSLGGGNDVAENSSSSKTTGSDAHTHSGSVSGTTGGSGTLNASGTSGSTAPSLSGAVSSTGSSTPFNVVQPTIILKKCIYTGV